ncbi:transcription initiation factor TFIIH subunit 4 [Nematocida ausubeli]|nr:transcription initiation factor TFIIH subunit 4 [Nematocida ausubeli]KAI5163957.1 transcription initiation factor TFIIH subunit 4 [Nematocida ausubeli]
MGECPVSRFLAQIKELEEEKMHRSDVILAIFKLLDESEKRALFSLMSSNISVRRVEQESVHKLLLLGILTVEKEYYVLSDKIRSRVLQACTRPMDERVLVRVDMEGKNVVRSSADSSDIYSTVLYKTISSKPNANKTVRRLMLNTGIVSKDGLTHKGFNFLLTGRKNQMWTLVLAHIQEDLATRQEEVLVMCEFLVKDPKRMYAIDVSYRSKMLDLFESLGLITFERGLVRFSSTFSLLFDDEEGGEKFLTLESNFRLYIYSNRPLDVFIISLFSIKIREFPNMIVAMINEDSIRQALTYGITAGQIRVYLNQNSMHKINENVLEQIRLWEKRMNRIHAWESYIFSNFLNYKDFLLVESYCENNNVEHRSYRDKRVLVVGVENYDNVKSFIRVSIK